MFTLPTFRRLLCVCLLSLVYSVAVLNLFYDDSFLSFLKLLPDMMSPDFYPIVSGQAGSIISKISEAGFEISAIQIFHIEKANAEEFLEVMCSHSPISLMGFY